MSIIKTKMFILRPFKNGDEAALIKNINNEKVYRPTLHIPYPYTMKHAREWIEKNENFAKEKPLRSVNFVIEIKGEVAGGIGISKIEKNEGELGYWLGENYWGKGIMSGAVNEVTNFGFKTLKLKRIYADVFPFNKVSMRVLEKNGYKLEKILKNNTVKDGELLDDHRFSKTV